MTSKVLRTYFSAIGSVGGTVSGEARRAMSAKALAGELNDEQMHAWVRRRELARAAALKRWSKVDHDP